MIFRVGYYSDCRSWHHFDSAKPTDHQVTGDITNGNLREAAFCGHRHGFWHGPLRRQRAGVSVENRASVGRKRVNGGEECRKIVKNNIGTYMALYGHNVASRPVRD